MIAGLLVCIVLLLCLGIAGACLAQSPLGRRIVYGGCLGVSLLSLLIALGSLGADVSRVTLPLGLPWIGAHFRLDPLAAFFLIVVGLGSAGASLYGLGYGRHEHEPQRVLQLARLAIAPRDGYPEAGPDFLATWFPDLANRAVFLDGPRLRLSASVLRERAAAGRSLRYLVPDAVAAYIGDHDLYRSPRRNDRT